MSAWYSRLVRWTDSVWPFCHSLRVPLAALAFVLSLAAAVPAADKAVLPWWLCVLAFHGGCCAMFALVSLLIAFFGRFPRLRRGHANPVEAFREMEQCGELLPKLLQPLREHVSTGALHPQTAAYETIIKDVASTDYPRVVDQYKAYTLRGVLLDLLLTASCLVVVFASLYLSLYAADLDSIGRDRGPFTGSRLPAGSLSESALESIYWSSVTFVTLGYGDIHPRETCPWARLLVVLEVFTFFSVFLLGLGLAYVAVADVYVPAGREFETTLRAELERLALEAPGRIAPAEQPPGTTPVDPT